MKLSDISMVNFGFVAICLALVLRTATAQDSTGADSGIQYVDPQEWEDFLEWQKSQVHTPSPNSRYLPQEDDYYDDDYFDDDYFDNGYFDGDIYTDPPAVSKPQPHKSNSALNDYFNSICRKTTCTTVFGDDACGRLENGKCRCITIKDEGVPYVRRGRCGVPEPGYDMYGLTWRVETGAGLAVRPLTDDPVRDPWPCCCNETYVSYGCCKEPTGIVHEPAQYQLPMECRKPPGGVN